MANSGEIKVNKAKLEACERELNQIAKSLANRKVSITIANSRGGVVDELTNVVDNLNALGAELSTIVSGTAESVMKTRLTFEEVDNGLADAWNLSKE